MTDLNGWRSIERRAAQHGRTALHFDAIDLRIEGFPTAAVEIHLLSYEDVDGHAVYWCGAGEGHDGCGLTHEHNEAMAFVAVIDARNELRIARRLTTAPLNVTTENL